MGEKHFQHADLNNREYREWRDFLAGADKWSKKQIAGYQLSEIRRIVRHAYTATKRYRQLYDEAGVNPDSIVSLGDVRKLPFVTKEMIRDNLEDFSVPTDGRTYVTTGGSTGVPFGMYRDPKAFARELASKAHQYYRVGWREGDPQMVFRGLPIDTPDHTLFEEKFNELRCSSYYLTPEIMESYIRKARDYRPDWIRCYPSSGYIFARFIKESGLSFPAVKGLLCASENLYDFQKEFLKEVFGARVFSHYGHYELAVLAGYCEHDDSYHVLPQYGYGELIGADGKLVTEPGKAGEIVGTSFIMHATPFIRYRTKDYAVLKGWGCSSCGRPYQLWEKIEGRLQEFIITASGRHISMTAVNFHNDIFDHIRQFQFYQERKGELVFRYIPKADCNKDVLDSVRKQLIHKMGDDVTLSFEPVADIPVTPRGKHRFLIQKMDVKYNDS